MDNIQYLEFGEHKNKHKTFYCIKGLKIKKLLIDF